MSSGVLWHELMNMVNMAIWKRLKPKKLSYFLCEIAHGPWKKLLAQRIRAALMIWGLDLVEELVYSSGYNDGSVCAGLSILLQNVGEVYGVVEVLELVFSQSYSVWQWNRRIITNEVERMWSNYWEKKMRPDELRCPQLCCSLSSGMFWTRL